MQLATANSLSDQTLTALVDWAKPTEGPTRFSYDAAADNTKRRNPRVDHRSEDLILDPQKRARLQANAKDIGRNFAIASWMIRRHLDYVTTFEFHGRTADDAVNDQVEAFITDWSRPYNCDAAARHRLPKMIRLAEVRRVIDGDLGLLKLSNGTLQGIESDRIRDPLGQLTDPSEIAQWSHGVKLGPAGRALAYAIWERTRLGWKFERFIPAGRLCLFGYFDRFDQVRGISPLASALNPLRDVYENFDYALAKAKVSQLLAFIIYSRVADGIGEHSYTGGSSGSSDDDSESDERRQDKYEVSFGGGPLKLELEVGDDAKILESAHPSEEFQHFQTLMLQVALKALDIPFSFYDEAHTNFFGSRAAWLHYERSCKDKREDLIELLTRLTLWRLQLAIIDGDLVLPAGMTLGDLDFEWVPAGMPWWDPAKEIRGDVMAIQAGLDNPERIVKERNRGDVYDNIDATARVVEYARTKNVRLSFDPGPDPIELVVTKEPE